MVGLWTQKNCGIAKHEEAYRCIFTFILPHTLFSLYMSFIAVIHTKDFFCDKACERDGAGIPQSKGERRDCRGRTGERFGDSKGVSRHVYGKSQKINFKKCLIKPLKTIEIKWYISWQIKKSASQLYKIKALQMIHTVKKEKRRLIFGNSYDIINTAKQGLACTRCVGASPFGEAYFLTS